MAHYVKFSAPALVVSAATSFQVHALISIYLMCLLIVHSQFEIANSIQVTANMIHDSIKASISVSWVVTNIDWLNTERPWIVCVPLRRLTTNCSGRAGLEA